MIQDVELALSTDRYSFRTEPQAITAHPAKSPAPGGQQQQPP
eukprot:COSAG01_NODE_12119_length_1798_cov_2.046498_1_plen_41_part_10